MNGSFTIAGIRNWRLWFALLGGAAAWTGHLMIAYAIAEFGCVAGWGHRHFAALSWVSWMLIGLSLVMIALASLALWVASIIHRDAAGAGADADEAATVGEVGRFGLIANGLFLFVILIQTIPILFYLGHC